MSGTLVCIMTILKTFIFKQQFINYINLVSHYSDMMRNSIVENLLVCMYEENGDMGELRMKIIKLLL